MKFFHTKGFLKNEPIKKRDLPYEYDGRKLDELTLAVTMTSYADVQNIIAYLEVHRFCFEWDKDAKRDNVSKDMFND